MEFIQQKMLVVFFFFVTAPLLVAQDVKVITHQFYFDTDVHNRLTKGGQINFTAQDDGWLNGRIKSLKVVGYADCRGDVKSNIELSRKRAKFIATNLVTLGVVDHDFKIEVVGNGELPCRGEEELEMSSDRRVDVVMTYEVIAEAEGDEAPDAPMQQMIETGRLELIGVNFQPGMRYFLPGVEEVLNAFAESLKKSPEIKIELQGHICCHGKQGDGQDIETGLDNLSVMRAKEVYDFLIAKGIDKARLRYKGMGNAFPKVWPEMSNADQIANRRVEAVLWE
ncbi:MAG: Inner rane lipoprotein YiaD precursor [Bacteroidota bacterium]|jgi:outer membrane protein OmpA-like peptidoglycan-associated protein